MIYAGAIALAYALVSLLWAPGGQLQAFIVLLSLVYSFRLGQVTEPIFVWVGVVAFGTVVIGLYIFFPIINPDYVACGIALSFVVAAAQGWYLFLPLGLAGLLFTGSRTALVATGIGSLAIFGRRFPATAMCAALFAVLAAWEIKGGGATSFFQRVGIWQDTLNHVSWYGHGFGSFKNIYLTWSPHTNVLTVYSVPPHAYNDTLELISDLGIGTIPLWFFLAWALGHGRDLTSKATFLTFAALGLAYYPLWIPPCAQLAFFALGHLSKEALQCDASSRRLYSFYS